MSIYSSHIILKVLLLGFIHIFLLHVFAVKQYMQTKNHVGIRS